MASLVTQQFEQYIAEQTKRGGSVIFDEFIFANIPDLTDVNLKKYLKMPKSTQIVHRQAVSQTGVVNTRSVVYSVTMGTEVGNFDFNFIGLINKSKNLLAVAIQSNTIKKIKNQNNVQGNSITRSILLEFSGAQQLTGINVNADTWQIDFTLRLHGLDEKIRLTNRDLYGRAVFFDNGFLVKRVSGKNFSAETGHAYIEGVRAALESKRQFTAANLPCSVYADVVHHATVTGAYQTTTTLLTANKSDYIDTAGYQHYVQVIADIDRNGSVTDRRLLSPLLGITPKDLTESTTSSTNETGHTHKIAKASTSAAGIVQLSSDTNSSVETKAATPKAVKTAYDKAVLAEKKAKPKDLTESTTSTADETGHTHKLPIANAMIKGIQKADGYGEDTFTTEDLGYTNRDFNEIHGKSVLMTIHNQYMNGYKGGDNQAYTGLMETLKRKWWGGTSIVQKIYDNNRFVMRYGSQTSASSDPIWSDWEEPLMKDIATGMIRQNITVDGTIESNYRMVIKRNNDQSNPYIYFIDSSVNISSEISAAKTIGEIVFRAGDTQIPSGVQYRGLIRTRILPSKAGLMEFFVVDENHRVKAHMHAFGKTGNFTINANSDNEIDRLQVGGSVGIIERGKTLRLGVNANGAYLHNSQSNTSLELRDDKSITYDGTRILMVREMVGIPLPYPVSTVPTGFLPMMGQTFSKTTYPILGQRYPSGRLPDLRGEFIRGWDNGRGVDTGRKILSKQNGTIGGSDSVDASSSIGVNIKRILGTYQETANSVGLDVINPADYPNANGSWAGSGGSGKISDGARNPSHDQHFYGVTRPRNIAMHYICLAG